MLIERHDLEVTSPPCDPGVERFNAIARLTTDISQVLSYLNTIWKGAIYDHANRYLTWRTGGRAITVRPYEIAVSNLEDRGEAATVIERLVEMINRTWDQRDEIEPSTVKKEGTAYCAGRLQASAGRQLQGMRRTCLLYFRQQAGGRPGDRRAMHPAVYRGAPGEAGATPGSDSDNNLNGGLT